MREGPKSFLMRFEETVAVALLVVAFAVVALQVVARFIFQNPPFWTEELARYLFVWLVVIGAAEGVRSRSHITMDIVPYMLPPRIRAVFALTMNLVTIAALVVVAWYGWWGMLRANRVMSVAIGVPESFLYGAAPLGAALMIIRLALATKSEINLLIQGERLVEKRSEGGL